MGMGRWCFRPRPEPHELFSSWLHRLALANATRDHTLCATMLPGVSIWNRDPDRSFDEERLPILSAWAGVPVPTLERLLLRRWAGRLAESVSANGPTPWILPVGVYHRVRRRGLLFCPACVREGKADALWMWRMAWTVCCRRHRLTLLDGCPACGEVYMPHRTAPSLLGRLPCVRCGADLARAPQHVAEVWAWQLQQRLETALLEGRTQIHKQCFLALPLFQGLRSLVAVLLSPRGREVMGKLVDVGRVPDRRSMAFELRPAHERRTAMEACWMLLADWPDRLRTLADRVGMRRCDVTKLALAPAYWLDTALDGLPGAAHRELSIDEVEAIARWLDGMGIVPSWISILEASGVGVPVRVAQPALRHYLNARVGISTEGASTKPA